MATFQHTHLCTLLQVLGVSLLTFQTDLPGVTRKLLLSLSKQGCRQATATFLGRHLPVLLMYLPVHTFFALWAITFAFLPGKVALTMWAAIMVPYYVVTMRVRQAGVCPNGVAALSLCGPCIRFVRLSHLRVVSSHCVCIRIHTNIIV